jgi:hypothetical protein
VARLKARVEAWRTRDLSELRVLSLFLDGPFHAARAESTDKEGILVAPTRSSRTAAPSCSTGA